MRKTSLKFYGRILILLAGLAVTCQPPTAAAQDGGVALPNHFDLRERLPQPDMSSRQRVRFLTTTDFPPFNFFDQNGRLAGFHVDLVRAICAELDIQAICQIQAMPWEELAPALESGDGEAIIAGLAVDAQSRERYRFTRAFLRLPGRFIEKTNGQSAARAAAEAFAGKRVGVLDETAHEAMLRTYFPDIRAVAFSRSDLLFDAVRQGRIAAAFGDGVQFSFWLATEDAGGCCRFVDGPYFSDAFLGRGLSIAVAPTDQALADAFDYALLSLVKSGRFAEIYLRYFPNGLY